MRSHTGERPHSCTQCTSTYATALGLRKHVRVHAQPHLVCAEPGCGFAAVNANIMARHCRRLSHATSGFVCPFPSCGGKSFNSSDSLRHHKLSPAHAGEGGRALCRACNITFETMAEYTAHTRAHRIERLAQGAAGARRRREGGSQEGAAGAGGAAAGGGAAAAPDEL